MTRDFLFRTRRLAQVGLLSALTIAAPSMAHAEHGREGGGGRFAHGGEGDRGGWHGPERRGFGGEGWRGIERPRLESRGPEGGYGWRGEGPHFFGWESYGWRDYGWRERGWGGAVGVAGLVGAVVAPFFLAPRIFVAPPVVFVPPPIFVAPPPIVLGLYDVPPGPAVLEPSSPAPAPPLAAAPPPLVAPTPEDVLLAAMPPPIVILPPQPVLIAAAPPPVYFAPPAVAFYGLPAFALIPPLLAFASVRAGWWGGGYAVRPVFAGIGPRPVFVPYGIRPGFERPGFVRGGFVRGGFARGPEFGRDRVYPYRGGGFRDRGGPAFGGHGGGWDHHGR